MNEPKTEEKSDFQRESLAQNIKETIWPRRITMIAFFFLILFLKNKSQYFLEIPEIALLFIFLWFLSSFLLDVFVATIKKSSLLENLYCFYLFLEYLWLTLIIYFIGGITWIGGFFYWFTMMYANLHLPRKKAIFMIFLGILMFNELVILDFFGFSYPFLEGAPYSNIYYVGLTLLIINLFLIYVGITGNIIRRDFDKQNKELEAALGKLQEEQIVLKIRAEARTRNIADLSKELQKKVKERTADLERKVEELEKLKKLTKGREERLITLKKELAALQEKYQK